MTLKATSLFAPLMLGLLFATPTHAQDSLSDAQKKEVADILRQQLLENPELIVEAMNVLQMREEARQSAMANAKAKELWSKLSDTSNAIVVGNPKGDVTIVEFYDYQCGFCRKQHEDTTALLAADKNIRYIYRPFPIKDTPESTPFSLIGSHMAYAASKQGKFEQLHHALFTDSPIASTDLQDLFKAIGIDQVLMEAELSQQTAMDAIINNMELAQEVGINGTPTMIINGELNVGILNLEGLQEKVKMARKAK